MKSAIAIIASLVLLANTCAAVMSASTNPVLQYNTSIKVTPNNYQGLYSSGDGTSPFIMLGTDSIHAIAPASGNVIARRTFAGGLKTDTNVVPVVGADGSGDSVFVVALPDGTLMAWSATGLTQKWKYAAAAHDTCHSPSGDKSCSAAAMNFLGAKSCAATGGRALTFLFCEINEAAPGSRKCSWHSIDAATGVECTAAKNLEGVHFLSFLNSYRQPEGGSFPTVIVSIQIDNNAVGIDASTGTILFNAPVSPDVMDGNIVPGTFNGTFALSSMSFSTGVTTVHIHNLMTGRLMKNVSVNPLGVTPIDSSISWTPEGYLSFMAQAKDGSSIFALINAEEGILAKVYPNVFSGNDQMGVNAAGKTFVMGTKCELCDTATMYTFNTANLQDDTVSQINFGVANSFAGQLALRVFKSIVGYEMVLAAIVGDGVLHLSAYKP